MEQGYYVVQASDLPMYQICQPVEDRTVLRIQELKAGEENGWMGLRRKGGNYSTEMWGPYSRPEPGADLSPTQVPGAPIPRGK
jgi:hypothetical protein